VKFFFFYIFAIHTSSRHEKRCQMSVRLFSLFRGSIYQQCGPQESLAGFQKFFLFWVLMNSFSPQCSVGPRPNGLETRIIIKISTHPCYPRTLTAFHGITQKKSKMADSKKLAFSKPSILNIFFPKLSGIGPWVNRIN
jgi:hypothetical protein